VWVIGDLFQRYAVKFTPASRGIPLSNTSCGDCCGAFLVFGELRGASHSVLTQVIVDRW
jgi:hypothetical protein